MKNFERKRSTSTPEPNTIGSFSFCTITYISYSFAKGGKDHERKRKD